MSRPTYNEDHSSQLPALLLLANLGWEYVSPVELDKLRQGRQDAVILEPILRDWLNTHNEIDYHGTKHPFIEGNIEEAIEQLRGIDLVEGANAATEVAYDLLTIGTSLEQRIAGDRKSYNLRYIDWERPANNVYHVTAEFPVMREGRTDTYRPDIVLFVNGIPLVIIENKRPDLNTRDGKPVDQAIRQHARNQNIDEGIPRLYLYSQLLLALDGSTGMYGTTGTPREFWAVWKEKYASQREADREELRLLDLKNHQDKAAWDAIFQGDFRYARRHFEALYSKQVSLTDQDLLLYDLLRPERLIELSYRYIVFDASIKKIARYQQYFAVQRSLARIRHFEQGTRQGGVIWHTQGSGKSLTMVMLAKAIALDDSIENPRVIIVTDRIDLDNQITKTFRNCGKETYQAKSGRHLVELLREGKAEVITTILDKFYKPQEEGYVERSANVFVLVDESHRSQYGEANVRMQQVLPQACFIGFTGTPLMKEEKNTARKYGGYIDKYTIDQAVEDGSVVPLLYEGREVPLLINKGPIDRYFEMVSRDLSEAQRADLKKRFARADQLSEADQRLFMIAQDVSEHFAQTWQGTSLKGQLTAPSKAAAVRLHKYFREIDRVSSAVVISPPDTREGVDDPNTTSDDEVQRFWNDMMRQYGGASNYQKQLIDSFKNGEQPEILIVVDKLLTGFDAPRNTVLYMARKLREHNLLQAIARVNRVYDGEKKDHGYIIDYHGILGELDQALHAYSSLSGFDEEDLKGTVTSVHEEIERLKQVHADLWAIFKGVSNKLDHEAMEQYLADEDRRQDFYELHGQFARLLKLALSTLSWVERTPEDKQRTYQGDLKFFTALRNSVKRRYSDQVDYGKYAKQIQRLIDQHVSAGDVEVRVELVDISNKEAFEEEVEKAVGPRAKADLIASRTAKHISENLERDPAFYKKLSEMLQEVVDEMHERWAELSEAARREYLERIREIKERALDRREPALPRELIDTPLATALYHMLGAQLSSEVPPDQAADNPLREQLVELANGIHQAILAHKKVDWKKRYDVQREMKRAMDDVIYPFTKQYGLQDLDMDQVIDQALELALKNLD